MEIAVEASGQLNFAFRFCEMKSHLLIFFSIALAGLASCGTVDPSVTPNHSNKKTYSSPRKLIEEMMLASENDDFDTFRNCFINDNDKIEEVEITFELNRSIIRLRKKLGEVYGERGIDYFAERQSHGKISFGVGWKAEDEKWWEDVEIVIEGSEAFYIPPHMDPFAERLSYEEGGWRHHPREFGPKESADGTTVWQMVRGTIKACNAISNTANENTSLEDSKSEFLRIFQAESGFEVY